MSSNALPRVTVLFFHPFPRRSQTNGPMREAIRDLPGVEVRDMYEIYPDFSIDVEAEQAVLLRSDVVVFQHPFYWYNCPSLMKEWLDSVLEMGWAYGPGGDRLTGKFWLQVVSTGGGANVYQRSEYNLFSIHELLRPFEQSALLCGMTPLEPFLTHGTGQLSLAQRQVQAQKYRNLLQNIAQGRIPAPFSSRSTRPAHGSEATP